MTVRLAADLGPGARGGFTMRTGGVSRGRYGAADATGGLNLALHVGDDEDRVLANRDLLDRWAGSHVAFMSQCHGTRVGAVSRPPDRDRSSVGEYDALVVPGPRTGHGAPATVAVMVADCVPLLLASPDGAQVAAVHVGRQGLLAGVVPAALEQLEAAGAVRHELYASLGPSICGRCYEVPQGMRTEVSAVVPAARATTSWGTPSLDVAAGVRDQLAEHDVSRVEQHAVCTYEDRRYYSYRRDGTTGRFVGAVGARATTRRR